MAFKNGKQYMDVVTYTGNGGTQTISGLEFSPDFVWIKSRSNSGYAHILQDTVRGSGEILFTNNTNAEVGNSGDFIGSFNSDGFSVNTNYLGGTAPDTNGDTSDFVAWCWDAGDTTVTNTDGTISAQVRANPAAGFSIVSYTGNATAGATVGHGLGSPLGLYIIKNRDSAQNWIVLGDGPDTAGADTVLTLNTTNSRTTSATTTASNNSTFPLSQYPDVNGSGNSHVAYCWAPVEGYSAFGSYTGNGDSNGPFVYTGFKPRWILIKNASTGSLNWRIVDTETSPTNPMSKVLYPNVADAEATSTANQIDALSNGFKIRGSGTGTNTSGDAIIYAAFAEGSFATDPGTQDLTFASDEDIANLFVGNEIQQGAASGTIVAKDSGTNTITVTPSSYQTGSPVTSTVNGEGTISAIDIPNNRMDVTVTSGGFASGVGRSVVGSVRRLPKYQAETASITDVTSIIGADYEISQSLRFNSADSAYLSRTPAVSGNRKTWTWSCWLKLSSESTLQNLFSNLNSSNTYGFYFYKNATGNLGIQDYGLTGGLFIQTTARFNDLSSWIHIVFVYDTTQATASDRARLYIDGVRLTDIGVGQYPTQNIDGLWNSSGFSTIGNQGSFDSNYLDGYLAEVNFIDGQALDPTSFGEFDDNGVWRAKVFVGSYGTNGFYLPLSSPSVGADASGNSNDWTPIGFPAAASSDTSVLTPATNAPPTIDYLVIGGGGGGPAEAYAGGGGAGGYRTSIGTSGGGSGAESALAVSPSTSYAVQVGRGGAANQNGFDSTFGPIVSLGGGKGGGPNSAGSAGGSGGGGGGSTAINTQNQPTYSGGGGTAGQGNSGGTSSNGGVRDAYVCVAQPGSSWCDYVTPGNGGKGGGASGTPAGLASSITGTSVTRATGGARQTSSVISVAGAANTGDGGSGAAGGSGVIVLSYPDTYNDLIIGSRLSHTYAVTGGNKVYTITASNDVIGSFIDSPTDGNQTDTGAGGEVVGNYCTWNPLSAYYTSPGYITLSDGNLYISTRNNGYPGGYFGTQAVNSGKYYWEIKCMPGMSVKNGGYLELGVSSITTGNRDNYQWTSGLNPGDIIGVALDKDANTLEYFINGVSLTTRSIASGDTNSTPYVELVGQNSTIYITTNFGQQPFTYPAPAGFKALCTTNLPFG